MILPNNANATRVNHLVRYFNHRPTRSTWGRHFSVVSKPPQRLDGGLAADRRLLTLVLLCGVPTVLLFLLHGPVLAGKCFWGMLGAVSLGLVASGRPDQLLHLLLSLTPWLNLLRDFAFYNILTVLFAGALFSHYLLRRNEVASILRRLPCAWALLVTASLYWLVSVAVTRNYASNLRVLEFIGVLFSVVIIGRNPQELRPVLLGLLLSACGVGIGMMHYSFASGGRLGMAMIDDEQSIGNPVQLGAPLALGLLALSVDRACWLGLRNRPWLRYALIVIVTWLLASTTSRASWIVVLAGFAAVLAVGKRQRKLLLLPLLGAAAVCGFLLLSPSGVMFQKYVAKTLGANATNSTITTGRSDQWLVGVTAFTDSPIGMVFGHGPGMGPQSYARFSQITTGVTYGWGRPRAWHSLFLLLMVETGLLGLVPFFLWLGVVGATVLRRALRFRSLFPLTCFGGYVCTVLTVPGFDAGCGIYLGVALIATLRPAQTGTQPSAQSRPVVGAAPIQTGTRKLIRRLHSARNL